MSDPSPSASGTGSPHSPGLPLERPGAFAGPPALIHPDDAPRVLAEWAAHTLSREPLETVYRMRRHDGVYRWQFTRAAPVFAEDGALLHWQGTTTDVADQGNAERRRAFLAEASAVLADARDPDAVLKIVAGLGIPLLGDWCQVSLAGPRGIYVHAIAHVDPVKQRRAAALIGKATIKAGTGFGPAMAIRTGEPELLAEMPPHVVEAVLDPADLAVYADLGYRSALTVPLTARGRHIGALCYVLAPDSQRVYSDDDVSLAKDLAARAALAYDNALLDAAEREAVLRTIALGRLSERLALATDSQAVLRAPGDILIPAFGDWYRVELPQPDGRFVTAHFAHHDPQKHELGQRLIGTSHFRAGSALGTAAAIEGGRADLIVDVTPDIIANYVTTAEAREIYTSIGIRSAITVPLLTGSGIAGSLAFRYGPEGERQYAEEDRQFFEEVGRRIALAFENLLLRESEAVANDALRALVDNAPIIMWTNDSSGRPEYLNDHWYSFTGLERAEGIGAQGFGSVIHPEDLERVTADWRTCLLAGQPYEGTVRMRRAADGAYRSFLMRSVPIRDSSGAIVKWIGTNTDITAQSEELARTAQVADILQRALLPAELPHAEGLSFDSVYRASSREAFVGGDWYDAFTLSAGSIAVSIGDVGGHGVKAAATMGRVREIIRASAYQGEEPDRVLARVDAQLAQMEEELYVTALFGIIDAPTRAFRYASAGHPPPIVADRAGVARVLPADGMTLGVAPGTVNRVQTTQLVPGDMLVLYTDGLIEHDRDVTRGTHALLDAISRQAILQSPLPAQPIIDAILRNEPPRDDIALLTVAFAALPQESLEAVYPAVPASASLARRQIADFLARAGLDDERLWDLTLAVGEALANVIQHAYDQPERGGVFYLRVHQYDEYAIVEVEDHGTWPFQPIMSALMQPNVFAENGRGLNLMRMLTDHMSVERTHKGTKVRFAVPLRRPHP